MYSTYSHTHTHSHPIRMCVDMISLLRRLAFYLRRRTPSFDWIPSIMTSQCRYNRTMVARSPCLIGIARESESVFARSANDFYFRSTCDGFVLKVHALETVRVGAFARLLCLFKEHIDANRLNTRNKKKHTICVWKRFFANYSRCIYMCVCVCVLHTIF